MTGVYGFAVRSELPLARLRPGAGERGSLSVTIAESDPLDEPAEITDLALDPAGDPMFAVSRASGSLRTWCRITGGAEIDPAAGRISVQAGGDPVALEDRLLNTLIPLLLAARGELVLHAVAVGTAAGAVLFCGPSGRGKSTLAAVLGAGGHPVLAEDTVVLTLHGDRVQAWPGPVGVRLHADTARRLGHDAVVPVRGKQMPLLAGPAGGSDPLPVAAIVALEPRGGTELHISALDGPRGVAAIFLNVHRLDWDAWPAGFRAAAELVRRVPCHSARLPDDLDRVRQLAPALLARVA